MPGFSGGEDVLGWNLLNQIARVHEVWALTREEDRDSIEQSLRDHPVEGLHIHYVGLPHWLRPMLRIQGGHQLYYYFWQIRAYFTARSLHKKTQFQLFHHITYANDWMASFIGALLPIPYVRGPGGGAHRTPKGFENEYALSGRIWEKVRSIGQWFLRRDPFYILGHRRASAILVCNPDSVAAMPKSWSRKVQLFPVTGVSCADLTRQPPIDLGDRPFRILSAGSLLRIKGFSLAIKAFKQFADKHPNSELNIIGSGPEEPRLRKLIHDSVLDSKAHLLGQMPHDEVLSAMNAHDDFLFPSLRDGGGAVVIEAMATGTPVICLDTGGPGMHITDDWGVKITPTSPSESVDTMASALDRLYLNADLRKNLGEAAHERAESAYHWDKLGDRLMEIYQQSLGLRRDD